MIFIGEFQEFILNKNIKIIKVNKKALHSQYCTIENVLHIGKISAHSKDIFGGMDPQ